MSSHEYEPILSYKNYDDDATMKRMSRNKNRPVSSYTENSMELYFVGYSDKDKLIIFKEKNKMNIKNRYANILDTQLGMGLQKLELYTINKFKKKFGKEYSFAYGMDRIIIEGILSKFIKKYDKGYENHIQIGPMNYDQLKNKEIIIPLHKDPKSGITDTYALVKTGMTLSNIEDQFMFNDNFNPCDMYLFIFGKKMKNYVREIEDIIYTVTTSNELGLFNIDSNETNVYDKESSNSTSLIISWKKLDVRDLDTLFFSHNESNQIIKHIDQFNSNRDFYKEKQINYKTGILLYGKPGTGKSSLVRALATKYNRSLVNINISHLMNIDLNKLTNSINCDDVKSYIILLEDIDTLFLNREKAESSDNNGVTNKLLQFLDSNSSPNNVIFIATTNHLERLDDALLRDGRFDLKVSVEELLKPEAIDFCKSFNLTDDKISEIVNHPKFKDNELYNQSILQTMILNVIDNKNRDVEVVDSSEEILKKIENEKLNNND